MFEKLLSLLLHAKGGAVATVLVLGASGALVTATVENGMATVTITQPSQTSTDTSNTTAGSNTTTTSNTTLTQTVLALFNRTKAEEDPTGTATGNGCSDAAHSTNAAVKLVNDGYKTNHAAVSALRKDAPKTDAARTLVSEADGKIKGFRQEAVKAIHELFKSDECKGNADEDNEDEDEDDESPTGTTGTTGGTTSTTTEVTVAISCTDAKECAEAAVKEMEKVVETLKADLEKLETAPATTNTNASPSGKSEKGNRDNHDNKGKGNGKGRG
jgi:hypothetical protein